MTDQAAVDWPTCDEPGCIGIRLPRGGKCLAHSAARRRTVVLRRLHQTGEIDARGAPITEGLLRQILAAAPHDAANHPIFATARFDQATFQGIAGFVQATFQGDAQFDLTTFRSDAQFDLATFQGLALFGEATFQGDAGFLGAIARRDARFVKAKFEQARQLGPLLVYGLLRLDGAHFAQLSLIEASSRGLSCQRTRFPAGVQFRLRGAQVVLDGADLPSPSLMTGIDALSDSQLAHRERRLVQAMRRLAPAATEEYSERPRLLSVQGANLAGLGVPTLTWTSAGLRAPTTSTNCASRPRSALRWLRPGCHGTGGRCWLRSSAGGPRSPTVGRLGTGGWPGCTSRTALGGPRSPTVGLLGSGGRPGFMSRTALSGQRWSSRRSSPGCTGHCAKLARTPRTSQARRTSTTARWRCAATRAAAALAEHLAGGSSAAC
jgi:hypothetical protein